MRALGILVALVALITAGDGIMGCRPAGSGPTPAASYAEARAIIDRHCVPCHSERPTILAFPIAPNGLELDTAEQMQRHAKLIKRRAVDDRSMPLLNKTGMTEKERGNLASWIAAGAKGP
jgi:uncharacterized membrane protein